MVSSVTTGCDVVVVVAGVVVVIVVVVVVVGRGEENMRHASRHCCSLTSLATRSPSKMCTPSSALAKPEKMAADTGKYNVCKQVEMASVRT